MNFVNIIHDSRQQDRYREVVSELERQGIKDYTIWPAILKPQVIDSINASHKMIVQTAKDKQLDMAMILEDDCQIPAEDGLLRFMAAMPDLFDIYMGGTYAPVLPDNRVSCPVGLHCYIIHNRYYDTFLNTPGDLHIDTAQEGRGEFYVCNPMVAIQREGFSANNRSHVNYNAQLRKEQVYGW